MSSTAGAAPLTGVLGYGLDVGGPWQQRRAGQRSRALEQTYLLTGSVQPPASAEGGRAAKTPLKLPSLVAGPHSRGSMARLSLSEPSLLNPNENVPFEGFSYGRGSSVLQKHPPPPHSFHKSSALLPSRTYPRPVTSHPQQQQQQLKHQQVQSCGRPTYIHFSHAIQLSTRPRPIRRHSHNSALSSEIQGDLRPSSVQFRNPLSEGEPLSVIGKPCLLSCSQRSTALAAGPTRTQLHVFLPSEADGEEVDSESVDEGFMDELDTRFSSLKLQQGAAKTVTSNS